MTIFSPACNDFPLLTVPQPLNSQHARITSTAPDESPDGQSVAPLPAESRRLAFAILRAIAADTGLDLGHDPVAAVPKRWVALSRLLISMPAIEQAKGMIMNYYHVDAPTAFQVLRRLSSTTNTKINSICSVLVGLSGDSDGSPVSVLQQHLGVRASRAFDPPG